MYEKAELKNFGSVRAYLAVSFLSLDVQDRFGFIDPGKQFYKGYPSAIAEVKLNWSVANFVRTANTRSGVQRNNKSFVLKRCI